MNICIDVGNSTIGIGAFKENELIERMVINTDPRFTEDEFYQLFKRPLAIVNSGKEKIDNVIFSSVVPQVNVPLLSALRKLVNIEPILIGPGTKTGLSIKVDNPLEIGNDLIADLVSAKEKYDYPCIIADLGTASKILLLDKAGTFSACLIMPGLTLSALSLSNKAALLPEVSLIAPKTVIAKNTLSAMNAGIVYGHADMISGLINRLENEIGYPCKHILTGGGAIYVKEILGDSFIYDKNLNLDGLNIIINKNLKKE
jgi:type III pantothenate kinase